MISLNADSTHAFTLNFSQLLDISYDAVEGFTDEIDLFTRKKIIIPVHSRAHWSCTAIDIQQKQIIYYDSLKRENKVRQLIFYFI